MIRLPTALHSVLPAAFPCTPTGGLLTLFALTPGWGQDCNLQVMKGKKMVYDKHFSPCQRRRLPTLLQLCQSVLKAVSVGAYQGVASPHLINNTGVSYTHWCSSSEWPYLTKVAVLLRLPNPPSREEPACPHSLMLQLQTQAELLPLSIYLLAPLQCFSFARVLYATYTFLFLLKSLHIMLTRTQTASPSSSMSLLNLKDWRFSVQWYILHLKLE